MKAMKIIMGVAAVMAAVAIAMSAPELVRYMRIKRM
jgi:hypothetical protein